MKEFAPFAKSAEIFDDFYRDKPVVSESAVYLHWLNKPNNHTRQRLLEIGCGTGKFTELFQFAGWDVIGLDLSPAMCAIAHQKGFTVVHGDIRDRRCVISAESAVAAFAVMSYACANDGLRGWMDNAIIDTVFQNARKSLESGGRFVFDVVNSACAIQHIRHTEYADVKLPDGRVLLRRMDKRFDPHSSIVTAEMQFAVGGDECWREVHKLRAFSPSELRYILHKNGFRELAIFPMEADNSEGGTRVGFSSWYTMVAAEAI